MLQCYNKQEENVNKYTYVYINMYLIYTYIFIYLFIWNKNSYIFTLHCISCVSTIFRRNTMLYSMLFKTYNFS